MGELVDLRVRTASVDDLPVLRAIYRRSSLSNPEDAVALLERPDLLELGDDGVRSGRTRVAVTEDGTVVGFATAVPADAAGALELDALFVDPAWCGAAWDASSSRTSSTGPDGRAWSRIEVTGNPRARAFYERLGFTVVGEVPTLLGAAPRMHLVVAASG